MTALLTAPATQLTPLLLHQLLADDTRLCCVALFAEYGECCVCELTELLQVVQPKISRHLALLRNAELVQVRRSGQWSYYQLHTDLPNWAVAIIHHCVEAEAPRYRALGKALMALRKSASPLSICTRP